jgi:ribosomal protein L29
VAPAAQEIARIRTEIESLTRMGVEADDLKALRKELARLETHLAAPERKGKG